MKNRSIISLRRNNRGVAAAEMALVTPLLITIMFGSFELGNYFLSEHVVVKAVRDGARYAGRQSFADYDCSTSPTTPTDPAGTVAAKTQSLVRTGKLSGGTPRLVGWTNDATITVKYVCPGTTTGIYRGKSGGAPVVTVSASVPYSSLLGQVGLSNPSMLLNASAEAAVMGI